MVAWFVASEVAARDCRCAALTEHRCDRAIAWLGDERDGKQIVVWADGEHDIATLGVLGDTLARAIFVDDVDVVVDLSGVTFVDAATVGVVIRGRNILRGQSRNLILRNPSRPATFVLDLCGLTCLVGAAATTGVSVGPS